MTELASPEQPAAPEVPDGSEEPAAATRSARACFFRLNERVFAALDRHCEEVVQVSSVNRVPSAPGHLLGVAHVHGRVLPLIEIRPTLGAEPGARPAILEALVVASGADRAAIVLDEVLAFEDIEESALRPAAAATEVPRGLVLGAIRRGGEDVPLLDVPRLLALLALRSESPQGGDAVSARLET